MYRYQENTLNSWLSKEDRKPLVIRGARQIGKSTLVRNLCKNNNLNLIEINLERHRPLDKIFATLNMELIQREIEAVARQSIFNKNKTKKNGDVLFLDEIQETPHALPALRYFYEDFPHLPVVCAGSLLEFVLSEHEFSMPVGRIEYLHMGPMNFAEFLLALQEEFLLDELKNCMKNFNGRNWQAAMVTETSHQRALSLLRQFLFIGGMPAAIQTYLQQKSLFDIPPIHAQIIDTYRDDFNKYAKIGQMENLDRIFDFLGLHVGEKIKYVNISREATSRDIKKSLDLLFKAKIATQVYNCLGHSLPLQKTIDERSFKTVHLDVGLMNFMSGVKPENLRNFDERTLFHEGVMAEQFVGQHLLTWDRPYLAPRLYYWLREGKMDNAEIDFLKEVDGALVAIEVKSGKSGTLRSLQQWQQLIKVKGKNLQTYSLRYDLNPPSQQVIATKELNYRLNSLPVYMATFPIENVE